MKLDQLISDLQKLAEEALLDNPEVLIDAIRFTCYSDIMSIDVDPLRKQHGDNAFLVIHIDYSEPNPT